MRGINFRYAGGTAAGRSRFLIRWLADNGQILSRRYGKLITPRVEGQALRLRSPFYWNLTRPTFDLIQNPIPKLWQLDSRRWADLCNKWRCVKLALPLASLLLVAQRRPIHNHPRTRLAPFRGCVNKKPLAVLSNHIIVPPVVDPGNRRLEKHMRFTNLE